MVKNLLLQKRELKWKRLVPSLWEEAVVVKDCLKSFIQCILQPNTHPWVLPSYLSSSVEPWP